MVGNFFYNVIEVTKSYTLIRLQWDNQHEERAGLICVTSYCAHL